MDVLKNNPELFKFKEEKSWWERGVSLVTGIAIIIVAHVLGSVLKSYMYKLGEETPPPERQASEVPLSVEQATTQVQKTKITFVVLGHVVYYTVLIVGIMLVFKVVGLETTGLLAIIAAMGFAIGLALQGVLGDIASGILIALFQTYTIGEIIDYSGQQGRVQDFTLFNTILLDIPTNTTITIPNRKIQDGPIKNLSRQKVHFIAVDVLVSNSNKDFLKIVSIIREAARSVPFFLTTQPLSVFVTDIGNSGTTIRAKVPVTPANIVPAAGAIRLAIRNALARENVAMLDCVLNAKK